MKLNIWERTDTVYDLWYIAAVIVIFASVFGGSFYIQAIGSFSSIFFAISALAPPVFSLAMIYIVRGANNTEKYTVDKSLNIENRTNIPLVDFKLTTTTHYYPAVDITVTPIFSVGTVFNTVTCVVGVFYMLMGYIAQFSITYLIAATSISLALCWFTMLVVNIARIIKVSKNIGGGSPYVIEMSYSDEQFNEAIYNQKFKYKHAFEPNGNRIDVLSAISKKAMRMARSLNFMIADGYADPSVMSSEIKTIEYAINVFVMKTIKSTDAFFKEHKSEVDAAKRVYERDVSPSILTEALALRESLEKIGKTVNEISKKRLQIKSTLADQSITVSRELLALTEKTMLPVAAFPDFHELEFDDIERRVAAKNIVSGSLMQLVTAKESTNNNNDKYKLEQQIGKVKSFVRSLASNTTESVQRKDRIIEKEKQGTLYLEDKAVSVDDVDHLIAVNERYIDSYDNTLPINTKG